MKYIIIAIIFLPIFCFSQSVSTTLGNSDTSHYVVIGNTATGISPQQGTILQILSSGVSTNARISMDTYNGASVLGSIYQGRRAAGSSASPTAALADYTLVGLAGDGYGTSAFHNVSLGGIFLKSEGTMTNTSAPTYLSLMTVPSGSTAAAENVRISSTGAIGLGGTNYGTNGQVLTSSGSGSVPTWTTIGGTGTVTAVSVTTANGISGSVATANTTPAITLNLGAITPTSVAASGTVTGSNLSGTNTGDQTTISGNAGTSTTQQTARLINGASYNASADIQTESNIQAYAAMGSPVLAQTVDFPLQVCNTSTALTDGQIKYEAVWLPKSATLTGIKVYVRTLGSYTGDNNNRVGLYTYSNGTITLVASSANNTSLWTSAANAIQTIPFSSTYAASEGIYFIGILYNQSAVVVAPGVATAVGLNNVAMAGTAFGFTNSAKLHGTSNATDLPATITMASITASVIPTWTSLY